MSACDKAVVISDSKVQMDGRGRQCTGKRQDFEEAFACLSGGLIRVSKVNLFQATNASYNYRSLDLIFLRPQLNRLLKILVRGKPEYMDFGI